MSLQFSQTILTVERFGACVHFYRDLLGCELVGGGEGGPVAFFQSGGQRFGLLDAAARANLGLDTGRAADETPAGARAATLAFFADDVDAAHRRLTEAGVSFRLSPRDFAEWGVRSSLCEDPDGNPVEIAAPLATGAKER